MPNIFEVTDPRGREIVCSDAQWNNHILANHSSMKGYEQRVKQALQDPDAIFEDAVHSTRSIYYRRQPDKQFYIKVVVKFEKNLGVIITAFPADSMKTGENLTWMRSKL